MTEEQDLGEEKERHQYTPLSQPVRITEQQWPEGTFPLVTIRCITYNHVNFIRDAIEGFLMQETTFPVQILIHDDASTDGTADIVREYEGKYPQLIKAICQTENQYSKGNKPRQFLGPLVKGKYVAVCEGDDYWSLPQKLQRQATFLEGNPDYACCFHGFSWIGLDGKLSKVISPDKGDVSFSKEDMLYLRMRKNAARRTLTMMFTSRHRLPEEAKLSANGDWFLYSTLGLYGKGMYLSGLNAACFREHMGGVWTSRSQLEQRLELIKTRLLLSSFYHRSAMHHVARTFELKAALSALNFSSRSNQSNFRLILFLLKREVSSIKGKAASMIRSLIPRAN